MNDKPEKLDSFITDLSIIKLGADDTLVVRVPDELVHEVDTMVMMRQAIAQTVGTQRVLVVSEAIKFEVIKTEVLQGETKKDCAACFLEEHGGEVNPGREGTKHVCGKPGVARVGQGEPPCEYCGGSKRDESGADCKWCQPWVPRKFA